MSNNDFIALMLAEGRLLALQREHVRSGEAKVRYAERELVAVEDTKDGSPSDQFSKPLKELVSELDDTAVALTVPLAQTTFQVLTLPVLSHDELGGMVRLRMEQLAPFDAERLSVGWEILSQGAESTTVFAVALPVDAVEAWQAALESAKASCIRIDVTAFIWLRALIKQGNIRSPGRQLLLIQERESWLLLVVDDAVLSFARVLPDQLLDSSDWVRELTLAMVELELATGQRTVECVSVCAPSSNTPDLSGIGQILNCPVEVVKSPDERLLLQSFADRTAEEGTIDLTPPIWRQFEAETRQRRHLIYGTVVAGIIWLLCATYLFLAPMVTSMMLSNVRKDRQAIALRYKEVTELSARVRLIRNYMDRDLSAIELLRQITQVQPAGVTMTSFQYRRDEGVRISGETEEATKVYAFKDEVASLLRGETDARLFEDISLTGPSAAKGGVQRFDLNMLFPGTKGGNQ